MKKLSPLKAIKAKCFDCSGFSRFEVKLCEMKDCPLFPYRTGHNPYLKGRKGGNPLWKKGVSVKKGHKIQSSEI